jgi:hypothetical protein
MNKFIEKYPELVNVLTTSHKQAMIQVWETIAGDVMDLNPNPDLGDIVEMVLDAGRLEFFQDRLDWKPFRNLSYELQDKLASEVLKRYA